MSTNRPSATKASEHCTKASYQLGFVWDPGISYFSLHTNSLNNFTKINGEKKTRIKYTYAFFRDGFLWHKVSNKILLLIFSRKLESFEISHKRTVYIYI